ncbi:MFS transporter [Caulobacter flavus]|uniref:MFS transporter n=1 Tax=Caulobacter flavus TaxID=1679497 RepID=A0A2N5CNQ9_9CAUL|nr:MFS transporter [Caulobacter flavus]AYV49301.1 MFS transporter [Caulobacter flavus]PLR08301.1 MFS transporter [Caulobacter flavus]
MSGAEGGWIGPRPSLTERLAVLWIGVVGVLFPGVGPLLLGGLEAAGRLTATEIGLAGMAELAAMGVGAALLGPVFGARRLRPAAVACGCFLAALNLASTFAHDGLLVLTRAAAGLPAGALIWIVTGMIVRSSRPDRWSGIYLTVQTLAQLTVVAGLTVLVIGRFGPNGGFTALAALAASAALAGALIPRAWTALPHTEDAPKGLPSPRGWVALLAVFCFQAFILALWIYAEPLSRQAGHPATTAGLAFSISLAAQVAGGAAATALAGRLSWFLSLTLGVLATAACLAVFATLPPAPAFLAASGLFGFAWLFASPFLTPLAIEADPSRRAALLGPGASLLGCAVGPLLAALIVGEHDVRPAVWLAGALAAVTLALILGLHLTRRKEPRA